MEFWQHPQIKKKECNPHLPAVESLKLVCWTPNIRHLTHSETLKHLETGAMTTIIKKKLVSCLQRFVFFFWASEDNFSKHPPHSCRISIFHGTGKSKRLTCLLKLRKAKTIFVIHVRTYYVLCCRLPQSHSSSIDLWSSVQMSSHLFSPSHGAEESVVLTRIQNT